LRQRLRCGDAAAHVVFHRSRDAFGFFGAPVQEQPSRTFRQIASHEENSEPEHRTRAECQAPAHVHGQASRLQQQARGNGAEHGAEPEASINPQVGAAAVACRDELLDRRIDRRIFAADAGAGNEAADRECSEIIAERGCAGAQDIHAERHEKKTLASEPISEPPE
jgi:hypothetical protein